MNQGWWAQALIEATAKSTYGPRSPRAVLSVIHSAHARAASAGMLPPGPSPGLRALPPVLSRAETVPASSPPAPGATEMEQRPARVSGPGPDRHDLQVEAGWSGSQSRPLAREGGIEAVTSSSDTTGSVASRSTSLLRSTIPTVARRMEHLVPAHLRRCRQCRALLCS